MNLYFLRHGIALDRLQWHKRDADRPLTPEGVQKTKKVARGMRKLGLKFDWILTSPYRRAYDTAMIVADCYKASKKLRILKSLAADGDPQQLVRNLALDYRTGDSLLLVGHEPYLSRLISVLIGAKDPLAIDLKKAGLCKLAADSLTYGPCAALEWLLTPKLLKSVTK
jgi:phosphohistidine phosphatase